MYNIDFIGFSNSINVIVLFISFVLAIAFTINAYFRYKMVSFRERLALIILRILTFSVLFALLLNPLFEKNQQVIKKPIISVLIDNSASIGVTSPSWDGLNSYKSTLNKIIQLDEDRFTPQYFYFNSSIEDSIDINSIQLNGAHTDIYAILRSVLNESNSDEIVLITDGISTRGRDPLFSAQNDRVPIHTIAVGDSTIKKDLILQDVEYPSSVLINTPVSLISVIRNVDITGSSVVKLFQNDRLIDSKNISFSQLNSTQQVEFIVEQNEVGAQNYQVQVDSIDGEWTGINNQKSISLTARDDQVRLLYFSSEVHPDVGLIRNLIQKNESFNMITRTWIQDENFLEGPLPTRRDTLDLVIVHGVSTSLPASIIEYLKQTVLDVNLLYIHTPNSDVDHINTLFGDMNIFTVNQIPLIENLELYPTSDAIGHVIFEIPPINWPRTAMFRTSLGLNNINERYISLIEASDRSNQVTAPVFGVSSFGGFRYAFLLHTGMNSLIMQSPADDIASLHLLISNIISWTATTAIDDNFVITLPNQDFSANNLIQFNARVLNELGLPENEASITFDLTSESLTESRSFTFKNKNSGNYQLDIASLPIGDYKYHATASKAQQQIGVQTGTFTVGNTEAEFVNTIRNDVLLRTLSNFTNGNFIEYNNLDDINSILNSDELKVEEKTETVQLFRNPVWFLVVIVLLGLEWLLRRKVLIP